MEHVHYRVEVVENSSLLLSGIPALTVTTKARNYRQNSSPFGSSFADLNITESIENEGSGKL